MTFFPIMLRLEGRKCLVVGAGQVAAQKAAGLLRHQAQVVVVAPQAVDRIRSAARTRKLVWLPRVFTLNDLKSAFLVIAATNSPAINVAVFRACQARSVLCNVVDDPEHCDFFYPAVVRRGALQIAVSTNGQSPALAARLRRELDKQFGPEWSTFVEHVGKLRQELLSTEISPARKRQESAKMASRQAFQKFLRQRRAKKADGHAAIPSATRHPQQ